MKVLAFVYFIAFSPLAFGGSVDKVAKSGPIVLMESESEYSVGSRVCFLKDEKKSACGVVSKIKGLKALVKVKKSSLSKIKKGMAVSLSESKMKTPEIPTDLSGESTLPPESKSKSSTKRSSTKKKSAKSGKDKFLVYVGASYAPMTVFKSNNLKYNPPSAATPSPLWQKESTVGSGSSLIFGGKFGPFHGGFAYSLSGMIPSNNVDLDYDINDPTKYATLVSSRSHLGLFGDYLFPIVKNPVDVSVGAGLGYTSNTVKFSAVQKKDDAPDANTIVSGSSSLSVISLRVPVLGQIYAGPVSITLGATLSVGLTGTAKTDATITDPNSPDATAGAAAFNTALDHKKNTVGLNFFGGVGASF